MKAFIAKIQYIRIYKQIDAVAQGNSEVITPRTLCYVSAIKFAAECLERGSSCIFYLGSTEPGYISHAWVVSNGVTYETNWNGMKKVPVLSVFLNRDDSLEDNLNKIRELFQNVERL